jgi:YHS domain-containing protein
MQFHASELNKTNQILMELPLFQNLLIEKEELEEQVKMLKHNIMYFESANRKMLRKNEKLKMEIKSMKKSKKTKVVETSAGSDSCKTTLEEEDDDEVVFIKQEKIFEPVANNTIVIDLCRDDEPAIKMTIDDRYSLLRPITPTFSTNDEEETDEVIDDEGEEEEVVEGEGEEEVVEVEGEGEEEVVEVEGEEEEVVEGEEGEDEEVVEVEGEEETSAGSDSCKATLEEVVEGEDETEEVVEVEEEETEEVVEVEGEEEDVYEIEINGKTYYVSNEKNSVIYAADEDGEITIEAGVYKNGKPIFN